jgi:3-dehydroquinate dehydratase/shikimate dehydrogenase
MRPMLCATVTGQTTAELRRARDAARPSCDLVEVRLDAAADPDAAAVLADRSTPVIVTCRPRWEGGAFAGSEEERRRILEQALEYGADYVDIESRAEFAGDLIRRSPDRVVLSRHWFDETPADLAAAARDLLASRAAIAKIAVRARCLEDAVRLERQFGQAPADRRRIIIAMGLEGLVTRVLAARFGSAWTYAGEAVAPGQVPLARMLGEFRFRTLTRHTALYGVVGRPIGHSVSPAMHNAAFQAAGIDAVYLPLAAIDADDFLVFAKAFDLKGASVTIPYKVDLARRADEIDATARRIGAINTLRVRDGRVSGVNTDVEGFLSPLAALDLAGKRAAVLGAGGAARAAAYGLAEVGAQVAVYARRVEQAAGVAALVGGAHGTIPPSPGSWDLLVNATPAGMFPGVEESPLSAAALRGGGTVYDLVYNPPITRLMLEADRAGCRVIGGLEMLVAQAAAQFRWWTGREPSRDLMRARAAERLTAMALEAASRCA